VRRCEWQRLVCAPRRSLTLLTRLWYLHCFTINTPPSLYFLAIDEFLVHSIYLFDFLARLSTQRDITFSHILTSISDNRTPSQSTPLSLYRENIDQLPGKHSESSGSTRTKRLNTEPLHRIETRQRAKRTAFSIETRQWARRTAVVSRRQIQGIEGKEGRDGLRQNHSNSVCVPDASI